MSSEYHGVRPGKQQADWFVYLLRSFYSNSVSDLFGDLERVPSCNGCTDDLAGWIYDSGANNVAVVNAFETELTAQSYQNGLYTSPGDWNAIPGFGISQPKHCHCSKWGSFVGARHVAPCAR